MSSEVDVEVVNGEVRVSTEKLKMGKDHNQTIKWHLKTQGWTFAENGILIHGNDGQFTGPSNKGSIFSWEDANTNTQSYKYDVTVTDGTQTKVLDPTIDNEGGPGG